MTHLPKDLCAIVARYASPEWVMRPWVRALYPDLGEDHTTWAQTYIYLWSNPRAREYCHGKPVYDICSNPADWAMDLLDTCKILDSIQLAANTNPRAFNHLPVLNPAIIKDRIAINILNMNPSALEYIIKHGLVNEYIVGNPSRDAIPLMGDYPRSLTSIAKNSAPWAVELILKASVEKLNRMEVECNTDPRVVTLCESMIPESPTYNGYNGVFMWYKFVRNPSAICVLERYLPSILPKLMITSDRLSTKQNLFANPEIFVPGRPAILAALMAA